MKKQVFFLILTGLFPILLQATHLRSGHISVKRLSPSNYTCRITITVYTNTGSPVSFGGDFDYLDFGDGTPPVLVPETPSTTSSALGPGVGVALYSIDHTYSSPGQYIISYQEPYRNGGIINMDNSLTTLFMLETSVNIDPFLGAFDTPEYMVEPFFRAPLGSNFSMSVGAYSPEGNIIRYSLKTPGGASNYRLPENFSINPFTGLITWDTKFQGQYVAGEYLFTVKINISKIIDGKQYRLGTVNMDIQIVLTEDELMGDITIGAILDENSRVYVPEEETLTLKVLFQPNLANNTSLTSFTEFSDNPLVFTFSTYDSISDDGELVVGVLTFTSIPDIVRDQPYVITIRGSYLSASNRLYAHDLCLLVYTRDLYPEVITSVGEELVDMMIYPNPVDDVLYLQPVDERPLFVTLMDMQGQVVFRKMIGGAEVIDMRSFNTGVYLCEINTGLARKVYKIIKR
jgi:hypothetical protein